MRYLIWGEIGQGYWQGHDTLRTNSDTEFVGDGVKDVVGMGEMGPELAQRSGVNMVLQP